jgi:hypothetical protein
MVNNIFKYAAFFALLSIPSASFPAAGKSSAVSAVNASKEQKNLEYLVLFSKNADIINRFKSNLDISKVKYDFSKNKGQYELKVKIEGDKEKFLAHWIGLPGQRDKSMKELNAGYRIEKGAIKGASEFNDADIMLYYEKEKHSLIRREEATSYSIKEIKQIDDSNAYLATEMIKENKGIKKVLNEKTYFVRKGPGWSYLRTEKLSDKITGSEKK